MIVLLYLILGVIQGITEPIPVSSSGHLLIFQNLFRINDLVNYEILATITNLGSLLAVILFYKKDLISIKKNYLVLIIMGTIPAGIMGLIFKKYHLLNFLENNIKFIGFMLLITALFLFLIRNRTGIKEKENISIKDSIIIGLFQVFALIPGISRSGSTIVGGLLRNLKRSTACDFSFMLYIPISIATSIIGIKDLIDSNLTINQTMLYLMSSIMSFYFTYVFIKIFRNIIKNGKLIYFVIYCLIVGSLIIII